MGGAFVAKLPPELDLARDMATLANVAKREIHFYTEVVPHINVKLVPRFPAVSLCFKIFVELD